MDQMPSKRLPRSIAVSGSDDFASVLARIVECRGAASTADADVGQWLSPNLVQICADIGAIPGINQAAALLCQAGLERRKILVFGDYDADGICSITSILRFFELMGAPASGVVPNRQLDGHGVSNSAVAKILDDPPDFLVVVDCGTTAAVQLAELVKKIPKIVVLDHHSAPNEGPPVMPDGVLLINAAIQSDDAVRGKFGIGSAGVLVYLTILHSIRHWRQLTSQAAALPPDQEVKAALRNCLALAALTAIADMVPMRGLNRAVVKTGLPMAAELIGIQAMAQSFPKPLSLERILPGDVGFRYGPVLNAAGRIADGQAALQLMCARELAPALQLAKQAIDINQSRREITQDVITSCHEQRLQMDDSDGVMVVNENFHIGVVGLAAARMLEHTGRPAIVIGANGTGSGRSIPGFHIGNFIGEQVAKGVLIKGGGHAGAAGFTVVPTQIEAFRAAFTAASAGIKRDENAVDLMIEGRTGVAFDQLCAALEPFGQENQPLVVEFRAPMLLNQRWFGTSKNPENPGKPHMGWRLALSTGPLECVRFSATEEEWFPLKSGQLFPEGAITSLRGEIRYEYDNYHQKMMPKLFVAHIECRAAAEATAAAA